MPERSINSMKGDNGIALLIGGSRIYHRAPILSSIAALRTGIDLVYTVVPTSNVIATRAVPPNLIVLPIIEDDLTPISVDSLLDIVPKTPDAVAIGMGLSVKEPGALIHLIRQFLVQNSDSKSTKLLLDASALIPEILEDISGTNTIIAPHLGEYKRFFNTNLTGLTIEEQISNVSKNASK